MKARRRIVDWIVRVTLCDLPVDHTTMAPCDRHEVSTL